MKTNLRTRLALHLTLLIIPGGAALAQDDSGAAGTTTTIANTLTAGVGIRTHDQKSTVVAAGKNNSDDANLNYLAGDTFSRIVKFTSQLKITNTAGNGFSVGAMAWYDDALRNQSVPHGNNPNNYLPNTPLSDAGFDPAARFSRAQLLNAHLFGTSVVLGGPLAWRAGLMSIERERGFNFTGGLRDLETRNTAASTRPGALAEEDVIPIWAATGRWNLNPALRIDGFLQFAPAHSVAPGCGSFFSTNDYSATGCDRVMYSPKLSEQQNVAQGVFTPREADIGPSSRPDQAGLGASYLVPDLGTRFGVYVAQYHSRTGYTDVRKGSALGPGKGITYAIEYPDNKSLLALTSATRSQDKSLYWLNEISITNGQPVQLNNSDLQNAFLTGKGPLGPDAIAAAPFSLYRGYDRFRVVQVQSGLQKDFANVLGAGKGFISAEIALKHTDGLPDVTVRRYGRPENSDACDTTADCSTNDGYVTSDAWAYRIRAGLDYANVSNSITHLRPSIQFGHDVKGWSYDYAFVEGRYTLRLALDAEFGRSLTGNISYVATRGGQFNTRTDRDYVVASVGYKF